MELGQNSFEGRFWKLESLSRTVFPVILVALEKQSPSKDSRTKKTKVEKDSRTNIKGKITGNDSFLSESQDRNQ